MTAAMDDGPTRIAFVLIKRFNMMTLTTTMEPMRIANYLAPRKLYEWTFLSPGGGTEIASNDMPLQCGAIADDPAHYDMVFVFGSWGAIHFDDASLSSWLRRQERRGGVICGVELGVYILARAGLLSARQATTHWSCMGGFAEQYPNVLLQEQLFTIDRNIMTCAGGTAGIDLILHLIATQHGDHLASEVADQLLHQQSRPAEAVQRRTMSSVTHEIHPRVVAAIQQIEANIGEPLSMPDLAREVGLSQRQLERLFRRYMGCSVVQFSQLLRLQYARVLLTTTRMSIRDVSVASGFNSMSYFSQAFFKCFGRKPSEYRQAWPEREPAPSWPGTVFSLIESSRRRVRTPASGQASSGTREQP